MTTASKWAGALLSSFLLAGTAGATEPVAVAADTKTCKNAKDLTAAEHRQIARGRNLDFTICPATPATHNADGTVKADTQEAKPFKARVLNPAPKQ